MTNTSRFPASDHEDDFHADTAHVIIPIEDVWARFDQDRRSLTTLGLEHVDVIKAAIAYAIAATHVDGATHLVFSTPLINMNAHVQAYRMLVERSRYPDAVLAVGPTHRDVHRLVDIIGEVAHHLTEALLVNLGTVPPQTRLHRFLGRDIILQIPTEVRRGHECNLARSNSRL